MRLFQYSLLIILPVILCSSCFKDDDEKTYHTLRKKGPWRIAELKVTRYDDLNPDSVIWDTVFYNHGQLKFYKGSDGTGGFSSDMTFTDGTDLLYIINSVSGEEGDDLYLSMIPQHGLGQVARGGGHIDKKKGEELRIKGTKSYYYYNPYSYSLFPYATSIVTEGNYSCDWYLVAED